MAKTKIVGEVEVSLPGFWFPQDGKIDLGGCALEGSIEEVVSFLKHAKPSVLRKLFPERVVLMNKIHESR